MSLDEHELILKGKLFLIGLTFVDQEDKLIEQYQTSGTVDELTNERFIKLNRNDGSVFQIPYDEDSIKKAAKGEYKEKSTGNIIKDPDYQTSWTISVKTTDNIEEIKKHGFKPEDWRFEK